MTKREIAGLAIKLMGVWLLIQSLTMVPYGISNVITAQKSTTAAFDPAMLYIYGGWAASIALPLLLIIFSEKCAGWLIRDDKTVGLSGALQRSDILTVAFTIIGLYLVVKGIPNLVLQLTQMQIRGRYSPSGGLTQYAYLIAPVVQIGLGVWLFAGSNGIAKFWERIRGFGLKQG